VIQSEVSAIGTIRNLRNDAQWKVMLLMYRGDTIAGGQLESK